mgnify:CR=1 FL=1
MSKTIESAVKRLNAKLEGGWADGTALIEIEGEGAILLDADGARAGEGPADVTLRADLDTFRGMLDGDVSPTAAFLSGRLRIGGNMGLALKLGSVLS